MRGVTPEVNPDSSWDMLDEESSDPDFILRDGSHEPSDEDPDEDSDEQFETADGQWARRGQRRGRRQPPRRRH